MVRIDRKSSIENEPRTLNTKQIQFARDAALYVVNTRSIEEAMKIFTQDLKAVASVAEKNGNGNGNGNGRTIMDLGEVCDCFVNELRIPWPRDIVSAPF